MRGSYGGIHAVHTNEHASMKTGPLKALRQQKQQVVVCGLIGPAVCRIIELDMSDRSVGAVMSSLWHQQKLWLTDGFRCYCTVFYITVKWKEGETECCFLFHMQQKSKVRLKPTS